MIDVKRAYNIAREKVPLLELIGCIDTGEAWLFDFGKINGDGSPVPGTPNVLVRKEDGEESWITVPPVSNLALWRDGQVVDMKDII